MRYRDGWGWTLKLPGEGSGAVLERDEIVFQSDPAMPPAAAVGLIKAYVRYAKLGPQGSPEHAAPRVRLHDALGVLLADVDDDAVTVLDGERATRGVSTSEQRDRDARPRAVPSGVPIALVGERKSRCRRPDRFLSSSVPAAAGAVDLVHTLVGSAVLAVLAGC